ncbi:hypothetical protein L7F22_029788 [Adiantum nelumboides]|nr:hypothetical protein [Adiantum nelumboides]
MAVELVLLARSPVYRRRHLALGRTLRISHACFPTPRLSWRAGHGKAAHELEEDRRGVARDGKGLPQAELACDKVELLGSERCVSKGGSGASLQACRAARLREVRQQRREWSKPMMASWNVEAAVGGRDRWRRERSADVEGTIAIDDKTSQPVPRGRCMRKARIRALYLAPELVTGRPAYAKLRWGLHSTAGELGLCLCQARAPSLGLRKSELRQQSLLPLSSGRREAATCRRTRILYLSLGQDDDGGRHGGDRHEQRANEIA